MHRNLQGYINKQRRWMIAYWGRKGFMLQGLESLECNIHYRNDEAMLCITEPTETRLNSLRFVLPEGGLELRPGQWIVFEIPPRLRDRTVDSVVIQHKKANTGRSTVDSTGWDREGAYTQVIAHDDSTGSWIRIGDKKYAEPRYGPPEEENLHDCILYGNIKPSLIKVVSVGSGTNAVVSFHGLEVQFFPEIIKEQATIILTPGTRFAELGRGIYTPAFGGGEWPNMGKYPYAAPLNHPGIDRLRFPVSMGDGKTYYVEKGLDGSTGAMHIQTVTPVNLSRIEIAVGDTEDWGDRVYKTRHGTPERFRRGWAKLDAYARTIDGKTIPLMDNVNVPPRGVLKGSPPDSAVQLVPGDEIVIVSRQDAAYVMGVRMQG